MPYFEDAKLNTLPLSLSLSPYFFVPYLLPLFITSRHKKAPTEVGAFENLNLSRTKRGDGEPSRSSMHTNQQVLRKWMAQEPA